MRVADPGALPGGARRTVDSRVWRSIYRQTVAGGATRQQSWSGLGQLPPYSFDRVVGSSAPIVLATSSNPRHPNSAGLVSMSSGCRTQAGVLPKPRSEALPIL
jgi:hypothetical protein